MRAWFFSGRPRGTRLLLVGALLAPAFASHVVPASASICEPPLPCVSNSLTPIIVDTPTGPIMANGFADTIEGTIQQVEGVTTSQAIDTAGIPGPLVTSATPATTTDLGVLQANANGQQDSHNYGSCSSSSQCSPNLKLYEPTYSLYFYRSSKLNAEGPVAFSELVPSDSNPQQVWIWEQHSGVHSYGSNLCILTNSVEINGKGWTLQDWNPDLSPTYEDGNTSYNFGIAYSGFTVGATYTPYKGELIGQTYNSGSGWVASWREQNDNCAGNGDGISLRDGVMWSQDWGDAPNTTWKYASVVWHNND